MAELPKLSTGQIVGGAVALGGIAALATTAVVLSSRKKTRKRKANKNKSIRKRSYKHRKRKLKFGSKAYRKKYLHKKRKGRRTPRTAGKGRDYSTKRIRYTKKGQPYIILRSGKARFIKKNSARSSHKRKGGKY